MIKLPQSCSHFSNEHSTLLDIKQIDGVNWNNKKNNYIQIQLTEMYMF